MPDITDILGLQPPASGPQDQQEPPSAALMQQLFGNINNAPTPGGSPAGQGGTPNPLQQAQANAIQSTNQTPIDLAKSLAPQLYGKTRKEKVINYLEDMFGPMIGYQRPIMRALPIAEKQYQEQTGREQLAGALTHYQNQIDMSNNRINELYAALNEKTKNDQMKAAELERFHNMRQGSIDFANNIRRLDYESKKGLRSAESARDAAQTEWQNLKNSAGVPMSDDQLRYKVLSEDTNPQELESLLSKNALLNVTQRPTAVMPTVNNSTTFSQGGQDFHQGSSYKSPMGILQAILNPGGALNHLFGGAATQQNAAQPQPPTPPIGGVGAPQANPTQPTTIPNIPQTASAGAASPGGLPAVDTGNYNKYLDPFEPNPPANIKIPTPIQHDRNKSMAEVAAQVTKIRPYENQAGMLATDIARAIGNGTANKYMGLIQGSPLMQAIRGSTGTITPDEAIGKVNFLDMLYNKLGANVRGRFTVPEIAGHARAVGGTLQTPTNALTTISALNLQAQAQRMFWQNAMAGKGQLTQQDRQDIAQVMAKELDRIAEMAQDPKNKALMASGGLGPGNLEQLLAEYRKYDGLSDYEVKKQAAKMRAVNVIPRKQ